jgi:hypothetical protein
LSFPTRDDGDKARYPPRRQGTETESMPQVKF